MFPISPHVRLPALVVLILVALGCGATQRPEAASGLRSTFEGSVQEFSGPGVLLVVTWADWASMWKLLEPELETFQNEAPADVEFRIVNVDQEPEIAKQLGASIVWRGR